MRELDTDVAATESQRAEWRVPVMTRFEAEDAENGTNAATDGLIVS